MADRTWEERGKWMDAHRAQLTHWGDNSASVLYYVGEHVKAGPQMPRATDAIDLAIAECEAAERAKAEQDKAEEERTRRERSPVAALLDDANFLHTCRDHHQQIRHFVARDQLRAAVEYQCATWRKMWNDLSNPSDHPSNYTRGYCTALRDCARDLEGEQ